jgi:sugar lactone lactonase YvrE
MEDSGTLKLLATDNQPAQRLVFSPDGKPLYVNDTCVKKLYVHDLWMAK